MKAFISYSHADEKYLEMLHKHLALLKREKVLSVWYDREILVGEDIDTEVIVELNSSDIFIALVSPDFFASDYCSEVEMKTALRRFEAGEMRLLSIIVEPCEWKYSPLSQVKVAPRDGKSVSEWTNPNSAFLDVTSEIRRILKAEKPKQRSKETEKPPSKTLKRSLIVKRTFDKVDRAKFLNVGYSVISKYFRDAIEEISSVEGIDGSYNSVSPTAFTATIINEKFSRGVAHITVHKKTSGQFSFGDIGFVFEENAPVGTENGSFSIENDEYELYFKDCFMMYSYITSEDEKLQPEEAALKLWDTFLDQAGMNYG